MLTKVKQSKETEIRRKLAQSGITKAQEYEEIISNLINQRQRLNTDLNILREKVVTLQQKEAQRQVTRNLRKRPSASKNQINYRQELNKKYEELKHWQKLSLKAMKNTRLEIQYKAFLDKVSWLEQQIQTALKQLNDEYIINKRLNKAMKANTKEQKKSNNVQETIEQQNQNIKKRIFSMKKVVNQQNSKQIYLQDYLIEIKEKDRLQERQIESRLRRSSVDIRKSSVGRVKTEAARSSYAELDVNFIDEIIEFELLPQQIISKQEVSRIQNNLNSMQSRWKSSISEIEDTIQRQNAREILALKRQGSRLTYRKEFEIVIEQLKSMIEQMSNLNHKKIGLYMQMHSTNGQQLSKSKLSEKPRHKKQHTDQLGKKVKQVQSLLKYPRGQSVNVQNQLNFASTQLQYGIQAFSQIMSTQYFGFGSFRKDFVGQLCQNTYFDRFLLRDERQTSLKTLQIYYSDRGIATIKAHYNIHSNNTTKQSNIGIPTEFLKNYCQIHVIDTNCDDFIRYFKLKHNVLENRVTQIKIVTNKGLKNGWGDAKIKGQVLHEDEQSQKQMVLDINQDQYPVSIFCSHIQKGPYWYLCGFGVQINDL